MTVLTDKQIFDALRERRGKPLTQSDVDAVNAVLYPAKGRTVSKAGLDLIREFEGLRLTAYPDPGSGGEPWTIGVGTTVYPDGRKVKKGDTITQAQAMEYLAHDVARFADGVAKLIGDAPTTQGQFDSLVSFSYNLGLNNLAKSTLLKKHVTGDYEGAASEFGKWVNANGKRMNGLVRRRDAERAIYLGRDK